MFMATNTYTFEDLIIHGNTFFGDKLFTVNFIYIDLYMLNFIYILQKI